MNNSLVVTGPEKVGVKYLATESLRPNPYNPRRLFDRLPLQTLEKSINKVGILVPLTVYWDDAHQRYIILDGQRRWLCASNLGLPTVPANIVAKPTLVQNIVTMFQIHKLREDWELMPTALTLEILMKELKETRVRPLSELTGLDQAVVVRCKKLLSYPKKFQDLMLDPDPEARVKSDFFIELYAVLSDRQVKKMEWYRRERFTGQMLVRYRAKKLRAVTDFRLVKQHINNAVKGGKTSQISRKLREFSEDPELPVEYLEISDAIVEKQIKVILGTIRSLEAALAEIEVAAAYGNEELWKRLETLAALIQAKLTEADRGKK